MSILIQNGTLLCPEGPVKADLRVEDGKIAQLGPALPAGDSQVLDAAGKLVFPGFIDTHTHFEMNKGLPNETADDWASGTRAAVAGGTTCVLDFAEPVKGASLASAAEEWHRRADGRSSCHYGFHMTIKDWDLRIREELPAMTAEGITSYKVYLAYDNLRVTDGVAYEVLRAVAEQGGVVGCHCENGDLVTEGIAAQKAAGHLSPAAHPLSRPAAVEAEAVGRWLAIAELAGCPVNVVHLSTRRGLELVRAARERGQKVYVETCPQYLLLNDSKYQLPGFESAKFVLSPPLRKADDQATLWEALRSGEVDTVGTDHCSFDFDGVKTLGRDGVSLNREVIDLRYVEQLCDSEPAAALGYCMLLAQRELLDGRRTVRQVVDALEARIDRAGLASLCGRREAVPLLARPRRQEIFACFNRFRGLRL